MNRVCLVGRLTAKPELRYTGSNTAYTRFSIAVNRTFSNSQGEREADFINIVAWRRQAENICQYLDKGSQVSIDGRIQTGSFTGQDGNRRYTTEVVADNVQFLGAKGSGNSQSSDSTTPYDFSNDMNQTTDVSSDPFADFGSSIEISDDELPF